MTKVVLRSLNILLGIFFIFLGIIKLSPIISKELHKDLRTEYAKYAKVFPFAKALQIKVPSKWYRRSIGGTEILAGLLLLLIPSRRWKNLGNVLLILTKIVNMYAHFSINDQFERMAPNLVFTFMLVCRLIVDWQFYKNQEEEQAPKIEEKTQFDELSTRVTRSTGKQVDAKSKKTQ